MVAQFYKFSKKANSTNRPIGTGNSVYVSLKESASVVNPVLIIQSLNYPDYNYLYLPIFDRYYFIEDIIYDTGVWVVTCRVDVLATWKDDINDTRAYVIFSDSAANEDIIDNRITVGAGVQYSSKLYDMTGIKSMVKESGVPVPEGTYGLTVAAHKDAATLATGGTITYYMNLGQFQEFTKELTNPTLWEDFEQFFTAVADSIIELFYIPFDATQYLEVSDVLPIQAGGYSFPNAKGVCSTTTDVAVKTKTLTIDLVEDFTLLWKATALEPARSYYMYFPYCGEKPVDARLFYGSRYIDIDYSMEPRSGNIQAIVHVAGKVIQEFNGNCKVDIPLSKEYFRLGALIGGASGAMTAIAGFASGNVALGATGVLSAISSVVTPAEVRTMGGFAGSVLGSTLGSDDDKKYWQHIVLTEARRQVTQWPSTYQDVIGGACNKVFYMLDLTGYCQTSEFSLKCSATSAEIEQVNRLMDSGVFLDNVLEEE